MCWMGPTFWAAVETMSPPVFVNSLTPAPGGVGLSGSLLAALPKQLGLPLSTGGSANAVPDRLNTAAATTAIVSSK
jgi:hypothetical protein